VNFDRVRILAGSVSGFERDITDKGSPRDARRLYPNGGNDPHARRQAIRNCSDMEQ